MNPQPTQPSKLPRPIDSPHEFIPEFQGTSACKICGQSIIAKEHGTQPAGAGTPRTNHWERGYQALEKERDAALRRVTELEGKLHEIEEATNVTPPHQLWDRIHEIIHPTRP